MPWTVSSDIQVGRKERKKVFTCHFGVVGDADTTNLVVTSGRHFASTTGSMTTSRPADNHQEKSEKETRD